jgi:hypothetical protein
MRPLFLLLLLIPSLVHAQVRDGVAVCCGRPEGFRNNIPPVDSQRFGQFFRGQSEYRGTRYTNTHRESESSYAPPFTLYNLDEGGYIPKTGVTGIPRIESGSRLTKDGRRTI